MTQPPDLPSGPAAPKASLAPQVLSFTRQILAGPRYQGPVSDHFDGTRFHNLDHRLPQRFGQFVLWRIGRLLGRAGHWPDWIDTPPGPPPPKEVAGAGLRVTFVNHATVLLQTAGLNLLTDPIWSLRASPLPFAGPRRRRPPGIRLADLPRIDAVLVSHNHYDHLDLPTLRRLAVAHRPRFVVSLGNGPLLREYGIGPVTELDWWQGTELSAAVRVTGVPAEHFSARGLRDLDATLWSGYVIEGPAGGVYFAGDTARGSHFRSVRARFGVPRLALLPIGGSKPRWFMGPVHESPEEAVEAHRLLGASTSVAIHFGTFPLADDGEAEPVAELTTALGRTDLGDTRFWVLAFGEGRDVP